MKNRIFTSIAIVIVLALLFVLKVFVSDYFFDAFFGILACFASFEMARLLRKTGKFNNMYVATAMPAVLLGLNIMGVYFLETSQDLMWILYTILIDIGAMVVVSLGLFLWGIIFRKRTRDEMSVREIKKMHVEKFSLLKTLNTAVSYVYPAFLFLFFVFLNHLDEGIFPLSKLSEMTIESDFAKVSTFVVLTAILIPMITDTFALLMGSLIGGKKLCPKISPNKTIAGAVGGTLWCVLVCVCVYLIFGAIEIFQPIMEIIPVWAYIIVVLLGSVISQFGDIFESFIKRRAGVKDSGNVLPGQGGILDRIDSYIFVTPLVLVAFLIMFI